MPMGCNLSRNEIRFFLLHNFVFAFENEDQYCVDYG